MPNRKRSRSKTSKEALQCDPPSKRTRNIDEALHSLCCCPITQTWMSQPVITPCGHTFDREAIVTWLAGHHTCPTCRARLAPAILVPNFMARRLVEQCAPPGTLAPPAPPAPPAPRKDGHLHVTVRFKSESLRVILKPTTRIARLRRACRTRFGDGVVLTFDGRAIGADCHDTVIQFGLVEGSVLTASDVEDNVSFFV